MDEKRAAYSLRAPSSPGRIAILRLSGRSPFPNVDDHLVEPEVTRDEIINGRRVVAMPADSPHAEKHVDLAYVLRAHVAPGYRASADLITRHAVDSDFATDACVYKEGIVQREAAAEARGEARGETRGRAAGRAEGIAEAILKFLEARGVAVSLAQRQEILRCQDLDRLDRWLRRAALASSADEVTPEP